MKNTSFGVRNELRAHIHQKLARDAARMDAVIAGVCILLIAVYAMVAYLDQGGIGR